MKDSNRTVNPFLSLLGSVFKAISFVFGTFILATLLEWFGMHSWWQPVSDDRLDDRTRFEMQEINNFFGKGDKIHGILRTYQYVSLLSERFLVPVEKYLVAQQKELEQAPTTVSAVVGAVTRIHKSVNKHLFVSIDVFRAWLFRSIVFLFGVVSVLPLLVVGLIDGLVRREIRRWSGGRESAWIFVFASKSLAPSIAISLAIYVLWPWSLSFIWINAFMGVFWGCSVYLALAKFKKYL